MLQSSKKVWTFHISWEGMKVDTRLRVSNTINYQWFRTRPKFPSAAHQAPHGIASGPTTLLTPHRFRSHPCFPSQFLSQPPPHLEQLLFQDRRQGRGPHHPHPRHLWATRNLVSGLRCLSNPGNDRSSGLPRRRICLHL